MSTDIDRDDARDDERDGNTLPSADERTADIAAFALGALSPSEIAELRAAIDADPSLADEIMLNETALAELAWLAPMANLNRGRSAGIRSRLVSRAASTREGRIRGKAAQDGAKATVKAAAKPAATPAVTPPKAPASPAKAPVIASAQTATTESTRTAAPVDFAAARETRTVNSTPYIGAWRFLAAAAAIACVATGTQLYRVTRDRDALRAAVGARDAVTLARVDSLSAAVAARDTVIASLTGPGMRVVDLVNYGSLDPVARMFWDRKKGQWTMYAYNLRQPKPGKTFQVWVIASNARAPISAGTFKPDGRGTAIVTATYQLDRNALTRVAVTEEPEGGVPAPTGPILIAGR
jgi:anti-sigma-K factor RskA